MSIDSPAVKPAQEVAETSLAIEPAELALRTFRQLLNLTPEPSSQAEASQIVEEGGRMMDLRETEMAILKLLLTSEPDLLRGNQKCKAIRDKLSLRDRQWASALERARREMARQRQAAQRARQAQRALSSH